MILTSLKLNQLSEEGFGWYRLYLTAAASKSADAVAAFFDENCVFQANNNLPIYGRAALHEALKSYFAGFKTIEHELLSILGADDAFAVEMLVHYVLLDGSKLTIPGAYVIERNAEGLFKSARLYLDSAEVFRTLAGRRS